MKTAISIPDELFEQAERASKNMRVSRSEFYSLALGKFLETRCEQEIASKLHDFYSTSSDSPDSALSAAQFPIMKRSEW